MYIRRYVGKSWSFKDLKALGSQLNLPDPSAYCGSFGWRLDTAEFHQEACRKIVEDFHSWTTVNLADPRLSEIHLAYESHYQASLEASYSAADLFGQILNITLLDKSFKEADCTLSRCKARLLEEGNHPRISDLLESLWVMPEFAYLKGFVNTGKHRRLIQCGYSFNMGAELNFQRGFYTEAFTYGSENHSKKWSEEVLRYRDALHDALIDMGIDINSRLLELIPVTNL